MHKALRPKYRWVHITNVDCSKWGYTSVKLAAKYANINVYKVYHFENTKFYKKLYKTVLKEGIVAKIFVASTLKSIFKKIAA